MDLRRLIATVFLGSLAGCAAAPEGGVSPAGAPAPEVVEPAPDTTPPVPVEPAEPQVPLEERWSAPFAVRSSGTVPPRAPRLAAVRPLADTTAQVAARTEPPADTTAAEPAPPAPAPPKKAPAPRAEEPAKAAPGTHRVASGETFFGIARKYAVLASALREANPQVDPDRLQAGAVLRIPAAGASAPDGRTHLVVQGDTLYGIARRYGVNPERIRTANRLESDVVKIGQTLVIPGAD